METALFAALALAALICLFALLYSKLRKPESFRHLPLDDCKEVLIDQHKIVYCQKGEGEDLLLIHGLGSSKYCWIDIYESLSKHFRVTALDLPGFGQSEKKTDANYGFFSQVKRLAEFCKKLGISEATPVGCSMGGTLALGLAMQHPQLVKNIVVISPAVSPHLASKAPRRATWFLSIFGRWIAHPLIVKKAAERVYLRPEKLTPEMIEHYYSPYHQSRSAVLAFWKAIDVVREFPTEELSQIQQSVLLLFGEQDRITPWSTMRPLEDRIQHLYVRKKPDGGHHLMEDQPDFVIEKIQNFLGAGPG